VASLLHAEDRQGSPGKTSDQAVEEKQIFRRGPIRIQRVEFLNDQGDPVSVFRRWAGMTIRVWYRCEGSIPDETLGLALAINRKSDLICLCHFNTVNVLRDAEVATYAEAPFRKRPAQTGYIEAQ